MRNGQTAVYVGLLPMALLVCLPFCGCSSESKSGAPDGETQNDSHGPLLNAKPLELQPTSATPLFLKLPANSVGITFRHQWKPKDRYESILLKTGFTGGGVCLGDFDSDGLCDIYFTSPHGGNRLYRNLGSFKFEDVTESQRVGCRDSWNTGATFVDVNNDGYLDLYVCAYDTPNHLFLNDGKGSFLPSQATRVGLNKNGANVKMTFADYDRDGDLDAFLVTNRLEPKTPQRVRYLGSKGNYRVAPEFREAVAVINLPSGEQKFTKAGQFDRLYQNQLAETGSLSFEDVTKRANVLGNFHGLDATWWDFNHDGYPDIYVANDFTDPDQLFRNNGDGSFSDVIGEVLPHTPWFAMGSAVGDLNNDQLFDLIVTDMSGTSHYREKMAMGSMDSLAWFLDTAEPRQYMRNAVYVNTDTDRFFELAHMSGLASSDWTWSVKIADLDNDGREDVFMTNGFTRDYLNSDFNERLKKRGKQSDSMAWYDAPELKEQNLMFRNVGDLQFQNVTKQWGLDETTISYGAAWGDLDGDGDLDLIVNNFDDQPSIYRNQSAGQNRVQIVLRGAVEANSDGAPGVFSNSFGVGSVVTLQTKEATQTRYVHSENGYMSSNEGKVTFGLGNDKTIEQLTIRWPSGRLQQFHDVAVNNHYTISEPPQSGASSDAGSSSPTADEEESTTPIYQASDLLAEAVHKERPHDDFADQPLLPNKLSRLGPGVACGDVDADGDIDLFVGGAAGSVGSLFLKDETRFVPTPMEALRQHEGCEDLGGIFLDADGDGDQDLFVASGGVESGEDDSLLRDRLYRNDGLIAGSVKFVYDAAAVPDFRASSGVVSAADFDRDGDLDIYVGGRVVPGQYPSPPKSRLLRNESGQFVDATSEVAPGLSNSGMVTGALWSDFNSDGWIDLLVTHEYGTIRVFQNDAGKLSEVSDSAGTADLLGWWNGISAADVDRDGDIDYAVTNLGLNTKYHPSPDKPQYIFYGDFEQTGRNRIVEAKLGSLGLLPVRGRSCSSNAMPFLREKFTTFHDFALASLSDIYTESRLDAALKLSVNTAESGILINDGLTSDGRSSFRFSPLPRLAQVAPSFGVQFVHANNDGDIDLVLAQNSFSPQRETGRMDGGLSLLLVGRGDGTFHAVWPKQSGISVPQDAKALVSFDVNEDGWRDLIVATNDGPVRTFIHRTEQFDALSVHLEGAAGNATGVGSQLKIVRQDGFELLETASTSGYLSQNAGPVVIPRRSTNPIRRIDVTWPDGTRTSVEQGFAQESLTIPKP